MKIHTKEYAPNKDDGCVHVYLTPNAQTARILDEISADTQAKKNLSPVFQCAEDAIAWLIA